MNYPRRDGTGGGVGNGTGAGTGRGIGNGAGRGTMYSGKINAPTMAYMTVYNKKPSPPIYGREANHETKDIDGVPIDKRIPTSAITNLNKYPKLIDLRASCEGDSPRHLTFLIFRPKNTDEEYVKTLVKNLKKQGLKSMSNIGTQGSPRICVADRLWYGERNEKKFNSWWKRLPVKIGLALEKTRKEIKK